MASDRIQGPIRFTEWSAAVRALFIRRRASHRRAWMASSCWWPARCPQSRTPERPLKNWGSTRTQLSSWIAKAGRSAGWHRRRGNHRHAEQATISRCQPFWKPASMSSATSRWPPRWPKRKSLPRTRGKRKLFVLLLHRLSSGAAGTRYGGHRCSSDIRLRLPSITRRTGDRGRFGRRQQTERRGVRTQKRARPAARRG